MSLSLEQLAAELHAARLEAPKPAPLPARRPVSRVQGMACPLCRNLASKISSSDRHSRYRCTACQLRFNIVLESLRAAWDSRREVTRD